MRKIFAGLPATAILAVGTFTLAMQEGHAQSEGVTEAQQEMFDEWMGDLDELTNEYDALFERAGQIVKSIRGKDAGLEDLSLARAGLFMETSQKLRKMALDAAGAEAEADLISGELELLSIYLRDYSKDPKKFNVTLEAIDQLYSSIWLQTTDIRKAEDRMAKAATSLEKLNIVVDSHKDGVPSHGVALDALQEHLRDLLGAMNLLTPLDRWGCRKGSRVINTADHVELTLVAQPGTGSFGLVAIRGLPPFKTSFRIEGLNRRWDWGSNPKFTIVLDPQQDAFYIEFPLDAKRGDTAQPQSHYFCTSLPIGHPDPAPLLEGD